MSQSTPTNSDYPVDGWLRGYFNTVEADRIGSDSIARHWRKNVDFLRLRDVALHRLNPQPGQRLLDVGCADGCTMVYCGLQGAAMYGQDLDPAAVAKANELLARFGIVGEARCGDATTLHFPDNHFDGVISSDFLEHITHDVKVEVLRETRRVLRPGRPLVVKTPNLSYLRLSRRFKQLRALLRLQDPRGFVIPHTPGTADPQHVGLSTRRQLSGCLEKAGFLNYRFFYAPLRRFGSSALVEVLSTEIPLARDLLCEDLFCIAWKPIVMSHFPD